MNGQCAGLNARPLQELKVKTGHQNWHKPAPKCSCDSLKTMGVSLIYSRWHTNDARWILWAPFYEAPTAQCLWRDALVNSSSPWPHLERNICRGDNGGAVQVSIDRDPNGIHANHGLGFAGVGRCGCKFVSSYVSSPRWETKTHSVSFFPLGVSTKTNSSPGSFFVGHFGVLYSQLSLSAWLMSEKSTYEMWHSHVRPMTYLSWYAKHAFWRPAIGCISAMKHEWFSIYRHFPWCVMDPAI